MRKVAIVTGGVSSIGRAICEELVGRNVFVIIADINEHDGCLLEAELNKDASNAQYIELNVTDYKSVEHVITNVYEEFQRLDYLFNNAGMLCMVKFMICRWTNGKTLWILIYGALYMVLKLAIKS